MKKVIPVSSTLLHNTDRLIGLPSAAVASTIALGSADAETFGVINPLPQQRKPTAVEPGSVQIGASRRAPRIRIPLASAAGARRLVLPSGQRYRRLLPAGSVGPKAGCKNFRMTVVPENFVPGLEGVVAFTTEIAEPDKDGGALRYRGVDIQDLVDQQVTFGDVWALLVDGRFGHGLPPAEPFPLPIHTGDVRVDVQAGLAMLAPIWGYKPLLDTDEATARDQLARASVMALSYVAQSARGIYQPAVPQPVIDECPTVTARFMTRWQGEPDPKHVEAIDAYWVSAAEHGMNASTFTARVIASTGADVAASLSGAIGAMSGPLHGGAPARVLPMLEEVERTGDARGLVKEILDRGDKLMGFGHRVYRAEDPRARVLRADRRAAGRAALRGRGRGGAGGAGRAAGAPTGPGDRDQRRVLGRGDPGLCPGAGQHDARDVHLWAHRGMVRPHSRAEAARQAGPPVGDLRRPGPAQPGVRRGLGPGSQPRLSALGRCCRCPAIEWVSPR